MTNTSKYDLVVIGGGPAGYAAAIRAGQLGKKVACVEKERPGGTCLNWGCIPSKSLLKNAELLNEMKNPDEWGFSFKEFKADISKAIDRSRSVSSKLTQGIGYLIKKNNIELIMGVAKLISSTKLQVADEEIVANNIIIATGARPRSLPNLEIDKELIITSRQALELRSKPESIAIIGASAIGCEFAYFFNAYGVEVSLLDTVKPKLESSSAPATNLSPVSDPVLIFTIAFVTLRSYKLIVLFVAILTTGSPTFSKPPYSKTKPLIE